ncbi:MAG: energy transducer TonB [Synechococcales cyanobacterium C42_A2020_086]|jgi:outer membrane biosynthesis protein TonB|nr:energy transducer TonB [Synechococcales cyanobacterium C42_A2020_086]
MVSSKQIRDLSSSWGQKVQEILKNPSAVAAIASLGAHGLLFLALPLLPSAGLKATEPEIKQSVAMVELTPEEQQRLPDFSTLPPLDLPPLNEPARPPAADLFSLSPLPQPPSAQLPPPGSLFTPPPLPLFIPSIPPPPRTQTFQIPLAPAPTLAPSPQATPEETPAAEEQTSPQPNETEVVATPEAPEATPSPSPQPEALQQTREEQLQARVNEIRSRREQLNQIAPDESGMTESAMHDNFRDWWQTAANWVSQDQDINELNLEKVTLIEGVYPEAACILRQSTNAVVAVLVDSEGRVVSENGYAPKLIRGSGYRIFNQEAIEQAQTHTFEPTNKNEARFVQVNFIFSEEACPEQETAAPAS